MDEAVPNLLPALMSRRQTFVNQRQCALMFPRRSLELRKTTEKIRGSKPIALGRISVERVAEFVRPGSCVAQRTPRPAQVDARDHDMEFHAVLLADPQQILRIGDLCRWRYASQPPQAQARTWCARDSVRTSRGVGSQAALAPVVRKPNNPCPKRDLMTIIPEPDRQRSDGFCHVAVSRP
jgi:hypothetical protein